MHADGSPRWKEDKKEKWNGPGPQRILVTVEALGLSEARYQKLPDLFCLTVFSVGLFGFKVDISG